MCDGEREREKEREASNYRVWIACETKWHSSVEAVENYSTSLQQNGKKKRKSSVVAHEFTTVNLQFKFKCCKDWCRVGGRRQGTRLCLDAVFIHLWPSQLVENLPRHTSINTLHISSWILQEVGTMAWRHEYVERGLWLTTPCIHSTQSFFSCADATHTCVCAASPVRTR